MVGEAPDQRRTLGGLPIPDPPTVGSARDAGYDPLTTGSPGQPPYLRGVHRSMYRSKLWTMRQYAGFSSAGQTNERFRMLLEKGQKGLSVAFDLPTQLGMDSDDTLSEGEVGKVGVAIDSIDDMRALFEDIDLAAVSTSMTINAPATILLALYVAIADERGIPRSSLRGTIQNDVLKEYIARGLYVFPPTQSLRLASDVMEWCKREAPLWNTISISGYHIREAGATAVEEVAFTLANALQYVEAALQRGMLIDDIAPRLSFFFCCHSDFFEEIAKFRAARALWHDLLSERHAPNDPKSLRLRFHTQTAGVSLTAQQPMNNVVRVAYQAMSAVLGGTQSLHTNSFDEALGLPTEKSATVALRTQQILAAETGVSDVVDPLAGSHLVEGLTARIRADARALIERIDAGGGAIACIESGLQQRMIHESAWRQLQDVESAHRGVIGVNEAVEGTDDSGAGLTLDPSVASEQIAGLQGLRRDRDADPVEDALTRLTAACKGDGMLMPHIIRAVKASCTVGEIMSSMQEEFGTWRAPSGI